MKNFYRNNQGASDKFMNKMFNNKYLDFNNNQV